MKWIEIEKSKYQWTVYLNRPEVKNAFNPEMIQEITETFQSIPKEIRVVNLRGRGSIFCSGADLEWMKSMVHFNIEENKTDSNLLYEMFQSMKNCNAPIVTVVHGAAMGGALGLIANSDIVLAENLTKFCFSEVKLGLAPAVISSFVMRKANLGIISPLMISGKVFNVTEAERSGLVYESGSIESLEEKLKFWNQQFMDSAPGAVRATKELINQLIDLSLTSFQSKGPQESIDKILFQKNLTTDLIASRRVCAEGQEGIKSFLEKRSANWREGL